MAAQKFLTQNIGQLKEVQATTTSAGAGNSGQIPALNSSGVLDITLMPIGVGTPTIVLPTTEIIAAGAFINVWNNAGTPSVRNANATDTTKPAHGYVLAGFGSGSNATVYLASENNVLTGLSVGSVYYLTTTGGVVSTTPPNTTGNSLQTVGYAINTTTIQYSQSIPIQLA